MDLQWWAWALVGLVAVLAIALVVLVVQRRRRAGGVVVMGVSRDHDGTSGADEESP